MKAAIGIVAAVLLTGCKKAPPPPPARPVLSVLVRPSADSTYAFTGTVEPRYSVNLGFRVLGRLMSRDVNLGDRVKAGQQVATIDATALKLALRTAVADLASARAQLTNATSAEGRQLYLVKRSVASRAQFESAQQSQLTASASEREAQAKLNKASEQLGYATLRSEMDGVVTTTGAEVGQVVTIGQSVVTVARSDVREAAVDIPEGIARNLSPGASFEVTLQLDPAIHMTGNVREIGPQADAATRTRRVRISLPDANEIYRLGTTITARIKLPPRPTIGLPSSALFERNGKTFIWLVDGDHVSAHEITLAARDATEIEIAEGLTPGMRVVVAGVNSLKDGERVLLQERMPK